MGEGKYPTQEHLLKLANIGHIKKDKALEMIGQVFDATQKWEEFADDAGVSKLQTKNIADSLLMICNNSCIEAFYKFREVSQNL